MTSKKYTVPIDNKNQIEIYLFPSGNSFVVVAYEWTLSESGNGTRSGNWKLEPETYDTLESAQERFNEIVDSWK